MSDWAEELNQRTGTKAGIGADKTAQDHLLMGASAWSLLNQLIANMATHGIAPASSCGAVLQISLSGLIQTAPGGPALDWLRAICDVYEVRLSGQQPPHELQQRLETLTLAVMQASRDYVSSGPVQ